MLPTDALRDTLVRVRELSARVNKHEQIRVLHWVRTLQAQPTSNATWMRNVLEYATALLQMLLDGVRVSCHCHCPCYSLLRGVHLSSCDHAARSTHAVTGMTMGVCVLGADTGCAIRQDATARAIADAASAREWSSHRSRLEDAEW